MTRRIQGRTAGSLALVLALGACGGGLGDETQRRDTGNAQEAAEEPPAAQIRGLLLAQVNVTETHRVAFWETDPGSVIMLQSFKPDAGDVSLDLGKLLVESGGLFGGLYRKLAHDEQAPLSAELVAADDRRTKLEPRDALVPPAEGSVPPDAAPKLGSGKVPSSEVPSENVPPAQGQAPTLPVGEPGAVKAQYVWARQQAGMPDIGCSANDIDASWCPAGSYYGFANGNVLESIYFDAVGYNPAGRPAVAANWDTFKVNRWNGSAWVTDVAQTINPGYSVRATAVGIATYYQASITGPLVSFAERWRLSFPYLTQTCSAADRGTPYCGIGHPHWANSEFGNDINGITHDSTSWIFSRTEGTTGYKTQGCIGGYSFPYDLQTNQPGQRCPMGMPSAWVDQGYKWNHYGDIVWDPATTLLFVSMNATGSKNGAIGVLSGDRRYYYGAAVTAPNDQVGWVALNPKNRVFYTSSSNAYHIHQHSLAIGAGVTATNLGSIALVNTAYHNAVGGDIQGGKVSSHGKLWVGMNGKHAVVGIDPYSGLVQTMAYIPGPARADEVEGLDITETDVRSPNIVGQIHVQELTNRWPGNDEWSLVNYAVSDLSRL